jgi:hypothetical protein
MNYEATNHINEQIHFAMVNEDTALSNLKRGGRGWVGKERSSLNVR